MSATFRDGLGSEPTAHALWTLLNDNVVNKLGRVDHVNNKVIVTKSPGAAVPDPLGWAPTSAHQRREVTCGTGEERTLDLGRVRDCAR